MLLSLISLLFQNLSFSCIQFCLFFTLLGSYTCLSHLLSKKNKKLGFTSYFYLLPLTFLDHCNGHEYVFRPPPPIHLFNLKSHCKACFLWFFFQTHVFQIWFNHAFISCKILLLSSFFSFCIHSGYEMKERWDGVV